MTFRDVITARDRISLSFAKGTAKAVQIKHQLRPKLPLRFHSDLVGHKDQISQANLIQSRPKMESPFSSIRAADHGRNLCPFSLAKGPVN